MYIFCELYFNMDGKITSEKENTPRKVCDEFDKIINFRVCTELI